MHLHILGICGTFMGGLAVLAREMGHVVTGSDANVYPPMSTQLLSQGIELNEGYDPAHLKPAPDLVIMGNAMSRGNPAVEYVLSMGIPYISGPQWLAENILHQSWVLAVAGTHGKTTTTSMLAWILEYAGLMPGFLIGGVATNFGVSARKGNTPFFVIEADEYDSAFFDKRSKFIHYRPRTLILNNLEFDHADIFPDIEAIKQQFHYLVRTVPSNGLLVMPARDEALKSVLEKGCWTPTEYTATNGNGASKEALWQISDAEPDGSAFTVHCADVDAGRVHWQLLGRHNQDNALAALSAARHVGVSPKVGVEALNQFANVKRRLEVKGVVKGMTVYDDFAHHPTAIATTLKGLRANVGSARIIVVLECGSYTMRSGAHRSTLMPALQEADEVCFARPGSAPWLNESLQTLAVPSYVAESVSDIIHHLVGRVKEGDHIVIMSNKGFEGIHEKLLEVLSTMA